MNNTQNATESEAPRTEPERALAPMIGRWITTGETAASDEAPAMQVAASDVYERAPGGLVLVHTYFGRTGDSDGGGIEVIRYDAENSTYRSHFFDTEGALTEEEVTIDGDTWSWQGEHHRCTAQISQNGKVVTAHHERSDDGVNWMPSVDVTIRKVE